MKKQIIKLSFTLIISTLLFQSCLHDVRTKVLKREGITTANTQKGKQLLNQAWKKHGGDKLEKRKGYSYRGNNTWNKGLLAKIGNYWPDLETTLDLKFPVGNLDGQLTFVDGQRKGTTAGLYQSKYYEIKNGKTEFLNKEAKSNKRAVFALIGIHYFAELLSQLQNVPIVSYAGSEVFKEQQYDLVFCTWEKPEPHIKHDQYLLWINKETGLLDYVEYSVREPHVKPLGYKMIGGALEYADYRKIDGVLIPHEQIVYGIKKKADRNKFLHKWKLSNFQFDNFNLEALQPTQKDN